MSSGNVFGVGKYCYVVSARRRTTGKERGGDILCRHAHSLLLLLFAAACNEVLMSQGKGRLKND